MQSRELYAVPIVTREINDSVEYAGNVYDKAGWVIHMLREQLGDEAFFRALKQYLTEYRLQNVVSADLAKAIEESSGTNVDQFFDRWIYGAGAPRFVVRSTYDEAAKKLNLEVRQAQKVEGHVGVFVCGRSHYRRAAGMSVKSVDDTFSLCLNAVMAAFDKGRQNSEVGRFPKIAGRMDSPVEDERRTFWTARAAFSSATCVTMNRLAALGVPRAA
jgi:hypothetical protein